MGRLLVLVLLVVLAVWLIRRASRASGKGIEESRDIKDTGELVRCAHCALLLPRAEARAAAGGLYCSEEHARLGPGGR
ncbi:MAG: PP0621 family protein [Betaproteobacteria bacterium]